MGAFGVGGRVTETQASQRYRVVPESAGPVFSLPVAATLKADPRVQRVMPNMARQSVWVRRRKLVELTRSTEDRVPLRAARTEVFLWRERQVDLQPFR